jgi:hypothetical protein
MERRVQVCSTSQQIMPLDVQLRLNSVFGWVAALALLAPICVTWSHSPSENFWYKELAGTLKCGIGSDALARECFALCATNHLRAAIFGFSEGKTEGKSSSGVFDPERKCLLGIQSLKITKQFDHKDYVSYFVPASAIRSFMPAGLRP